MPRAKNERKSSPLDDALRDASWHVSHAMALAEFAGEEVVHAQWRRAAEREEHAAFLLEAQGREIDAAAHRISAASCYEEVMEYEQALTLLHAALSADLRPVYRARIQKQLKQCLAKARRHLRKTPRKKVATAS